MSEGNGQAEVDVITLTRDRKTGAVSIGGNVTDMDLHLNMLAQATRHMEVQFRIIAAMEAQAQVKQRQEDMARVANLMRK